MGLSVPGEDVLPKAPLARLRLLIALDAFLVSGSVSGAAGVLDMSVPAASRLLAQLRQLFGDEILIRSGRGMRPTPLAEGLRPRVRALAAEAEAILTAPDLAPDTRPEPAPEIGAQSGGETRRGTDPAPRARAGQAAAAARLSVSGSGGGLPPVSYAHPPLSLRVAPALEGQPTEAQIRARLAGIDETHSPADRLGRCIATIGAGQGRSRPLDLAEAEDAFAIVLDGAADAMQIGALLMLLQYRGITSTELAGLLRAARRGFAPLGQGAVDLDWPGYLSPFNRNPPWFLLAAKLLGQSGCRIALHGFGADLSPYPAVLEALGIASVGGLAEAEAVLERDGLVHLPLPVVHPQLQALVNLYPKFQMRTPVLLGLQLLNPLGAGATLMGLPRAALATLHRETAEILGAGRLLCIDSHRDVAQATPHRMMTLALSVAGETRSLVVPAQQAARPPAPPASFSTAQYCAAVWRGQLRSPEAEAAVIDTAALGLIAMGRADLEITAARAAAQALWQGRNRDLD